MTIMMLLFAVSMMFFGGFGALAVCRRPRIATVFGSFGSMGGCIIGLVALVRSLTVSEVKSLTLAWSLPLGSFTVRLDALSTFFLFPIFTIGLFSAMYGIEYLFAYRVKKNLGIPWFFFTLLLASMVMVVIASDSILFLLSWEIMSLASFFLVMFEHEKKQTAYAGWLYFIATHLGTACIIAYFLIVGALTGTYDLSSINSNETSRFWARILFVLAFIGFGTKAGIIPFHIWLPYAHPAAPSHVSALLSGVMIKVGIYGICRCLIFLHGNIEPWWAGLVILCGIISGVGGVLFAIGQHELKRLLAYHSVENIGIILCGIGLGMMGVCCGNSTLAILGFCGGLLHILNHALFKSLLFFSAGAVLNMTHCTELERLGGLLKTMPKTAIFFLIGAIAICGLPPFNGFISELLIFMGAYQGLITPRSASLYSGVAVACSLGLMSSLAAACFTKVFGVVFLGEQREDIKGRDPSWVLSLPMALCSILCLTIGIGFFFILPFFKPVIAQMSAVPNMVIDSVFHTITPSLHSIVIAFALCASLCLTFIFLRIFLLRNRQVSRVCTWDCGYVKPTPRMQYSASSFAQPIVRFFDFFLKSERQLHSFDGYFTRHWSFHTSVTDMFLVRFFTPLFQYISRFTMLFRWIQSGSIHAYILYVVTTLLVLIVWKTL
ncbi:MAG: hypothetical protein JW795_23005 [Chitinivibrionales bacterium]|nr:hypothetical protein [Chitinivibrionales bacterium]